VCGSLLERANLSDLTICLMEVRKKNRGESGIRLTAPPWDVKICEELLVMNDQEINRAVQYVTASTSYGRETVATILRTGLGELTELAVQSTRQFEREALLEYVSQWTIKRTGQPEPLVREVLGCAGRWLDEVYEEVSKRQPESLDLRPPDDDEGAEPV
jgi:hypothetical protein